MIAIIDYGMGNLRSVQKALEAVGAQAIITQNAHDIQQAEKIVLPGVGAIKPAMQKLEDLGLVQSIVESIQANKPFLGICLGYQLLFETSDEGGSVKGLNILKGNVRRFTSLKIPQMGWNQLKIKKSDCPLLHGVNELSNVYFCHSFFVDPEEESIVASSTDYGVEFASSVCKNKTFGVQFHPEKSQAVGLKILKNFNEVTP